MVPKALVVTSLTRNNTSYPLLSVADVTGNLQTKDLFKDAATLRTDLIKNFGLSEELVDAIMESKINISKVCRCDI